MPSEGRKNKKRGQRLHLIHNDKEVFTLFTRRVGKNGREKIVKPAREGERSHYALGSNDGGLFSHTKNEGAGRSRSYDRKNMISTADLLGIVGAAIAPRNDPPPDMMEGTSHQRIEGFNQWANRVLPNVARAPTRRIVRMPSGSYIAVFDELMRFAPTMISDSNDQKIDITDLVTRLRLIIEKKTPSITFREDEMARLGHRIALAEDESMMIILLNDNAVIETSAQAVEEASIDFLDKLGLQDYLSSIRDSDIKGEQL